MSAGPRDPASQSGFTIAYQGPVPDQNPKDLTCVDPYQTLPDPVLAERNWMVVLVWSAGGLPTVTTTLHVPADPFLVGLDLITNPYHAAIWVEPCRGWPLPTFTTATGTGYD